MIGVFIVSNVKNTFKGVFAFRTGQRKEYAAAYYLEQAKKLIVDRLAKKMVVFPEVIWNWMKQHPELWEVKLEIEFTEEK